MDRRDDLADDLKALYDNLRRLDVSLSEFTRDTFGRVNPFIENVVEWHEKAQRCFGDNSITVYDSATVIGDVAVGPHTWIGPFCILDGSGGLAIGSHCSVSSGVMVFTHDTVRWSLSGGREPYDHAPTSIGDDCFIGTQTVILKGTHIGNACLIAANSLVNRDIPDNSIAAGSPARIIGEVLRDGDRVVLNYFSRSEPRDARIAPTTKDTSTSS